MKINCPTCNASVEQHRPPAKNDPGAGDAWVCFRCTNVVCIHCYITHQQSMHPEVYGAPSQPTRDRKKNKKDKKGKPRR